MRYAVRHRTRVPKYILRRCVLIAVPVILVFILVFIIRHGNSGRFGQIQSSPKKDAENLTVIIETENKKDSAEVLREWAENTEGLTIIEQYAAQNDCYITGKKVAVKGLMLHSVGTAQPSAKVYAEQFNTFQPNGREVCPHAFLQADGAVYQILPWEMYGWHAGGTSNRTHIGIEMCEPAELVYTSADTFYTTNEAAAVEYVKKTYEAAVQLFAALCIRYDLDPLEEGVIISHSEAAAQGTASLHSDPEHLWQGLGLSYTMDTFRADIAERIASLKA